MTFTIFGFMVILIGSWLLFRASVIAMLQFVMMMSLMSGTAAFVLTGLGGSTIPPAAAAMPFFILRCLLPGSGRGPAIAQAVGANVMLVAFAAYGALSAFVLPRIFAGTISVTPLRPIPTDDPFVTFPLSFSPQNITVAVYLLLTMAGGICGFIAARSPGAPRRIARTAAIIAIVHAGLGFASVIFAGTPAASFLEFFRNGFYAQLDQTVQGVVRMNGIAPEPSGYAAFGVAYFILATELWLRDVDVRWTRFASMSLLTALLISTSSTAYIGIGGYAAVATVRLILAPGTVSSIKLVGLLGLALIFAIMAIMLAVAQPAILETIGKIAGRILFEKQDSLSGMQRLMWAKQGWHAFLHTAGLGIGMGSFRSSSLLTAILGSTGIIGILTFVAHLLRVLRPFRYSTYRPSHDLSERIGLAASWTAISMLIPASGTAASPDPGLTWGLLGGIALALRWDTRQTSARSAAF